MLSNFTCYSCRPREGALAEWSELEFAPGTEGPEFKHNLGVGFVGTQFVGFHPAGNGYPTLIRAGEGGLVPPLSYIVA